MYICKKAQNPEIEIIVKKFKNVISLGYFCSVARELEKSGLRDASFPFDWLISDFKGVIQCVENGFQDFLDIKYLSQNKNDRSHYKNLKYQFYFFHDFDGFKPLEDQLPEVQAKYKRREDRFFDAIKDSTLFVRYISNEEKTPDGKSAELEWIEQNYDYILSVLKKFNPDNEILFISNEGVLSDKIKIYNVTPDKGKWVAEKFLEKSTALSELFTNFEHKNKDENIKIYLEKRRQKRKIFSALRFLLEPILKKLFCKEYVYSVEYDIKDK